MTPVATWRQPDVAPPARRLAEAVDPHEMADVVSRDIMGEVWPDRDELGFRAAVGRSVQGNVAAIFDILRGRMPMEAARPQPALDLADVTAHLDVPATELERAYRVGVTSLWSQWFQVSSAAAEASPGGLAPLLEGPSLTMLTYIDRILLEVLGRYESTRGELERTSGQLRRLLVRQIADGSLIDPPADLDRRLDYHVGDHHLAVLLYRGDGTPTRALVERLRTAAGARGTLMLQHGPRAWAVWTGAAGAYAPEAIGQLRRVLEGSGWLAAISDPGRGIEGIRRTYVQAVEAARVQRAMGPAARRVLLASEVRLEALLMADEARARKFVADELGPLAGEDTASQRLRETLLTWLSTGSHVNAAAVLGVHENTIRNRIRHAEELLDDALVNRRTELQVALRLERVLLAGTPTDEHY
jgi:hypothetical protein